MWVIGYLAAMVLLLLAGQAVILKAFKEPLQWTFGANSQQSKSLKLALKLLLQTTLIGSIFLFPAVIGTTPGAYYGPIFAPSKAIQFLYGEGIAIVLMTLIFVVELLGGWIVYKQRYTPQKATVKSLLSTLSSFTVVSVEEPLLRGVIQQYLLFGAAPAVAVAPVVSPAIALPLGAALFSGAHFIRKVSTYWPAVGLAVLGLWLGVAYYKTGALWLPMGLHSGGILSIGVHRCFTNYKGPAWLVGTQTFPIAGVISMIIMLIGSAVTWFLF
jgi:hypothetical protein